MSWVMVAGIVASIVGSMWAKFEHDCPAYWALWGISRRSAHIINLATSALFPGGYLLVLFAPGTSWWVNVLAVLGTHFIGVQLIAPLLMSMMLSFRRESRVESETAAGFDPDIHEDDTGIIYPSNGADTATGLAPPSMPLGRSLQLFLIDHIARSQGWKGFSLAVPGRRRYDRLCRDLAARGLVVLPSNPDERFTPSITVGKPKPVAGDLYELEYGWVMGGEVGDGGVYVIGGDPQNWRIVERRIGYVV